MTLRALCLIVVSIVASFQPRANFKPQELLCSSGALEAVAAAFVEETSGLELRINRHSAGMVSDTRFATWSWTLPTPRY